MAYTPAELDDALAAKAAASDIASLSREHTKILLEYAEVQSRITESDEKRIERMKIALDKRVDELTVMKEMRDMGHEVLGIQEKDLANRKDLLEIEEAELQNRKDVSKEEKSILRDRREGLDAEARGIKNASSLMERYLGLNEKSGDMFKSTGKQLSAQGKKLKSTMKVANLAGASVMKTMQSSLALALAQDQANVAFNKATGASGAYNDNIVQLEKEMFNLGVTSGEAGQATQDLFMNVSDFTEMSKGMQMELAKTVALLNELGVSSSITTKNIQFLTKVMGQTKTQAAAQTRELFSFASELGVSAEKMASDFAKAGPLIAAVGEGGVAAFKDLAAQAKASGMEIETLLSLVGKFDTFSSAADSVGKLNAILGGPYLNTLEMVAETDPAERMRKLSEGVRASGLSFDQMSYYQKKAMTAAAGLNSEMELALLLSGDLENAKGPVKTTAEYKKLAAEQAEYNTVMEELAQLGRAFAVSMSPLIKVFKFIVDWLVPAIPAIMTVLGVLLAIPTGGASLSFGALAGGALTSGMGIAGMAQQVGDLTSRPAGIDPNGGPIVQTSPAEGGLGKVFQGTKNDKIDMSPTAGDSAAPRGPTIINLKIGNETIQQIVHETDFSKAYSDGKKSVANDSISGLMSKEIMKA
jgi:hypothetical protein